jgi:two-component system NarL family sensor kinase
VRIQGIILGLFLLAVPSGYSQTLMNLDSLLKLLPSAKEDSNAALLFINIGQQYEGNKPELSKYYYRRTRDLSQKIGYTRGVIKYITNYTYLLNQEGKYDSSLILNLQSVSLARQTNDSLTIAKTLYNTGTSYRFTGQYEKAVASFLEGARIFEKYGDNAVQADANDILQLLYYDLKQYDKAIELGRKAVHYSKESGSDYLIASALDNLGVALVKMKQLDEAEAAFKEAIVAARRIGDLNLESTILLNFADIAIEKSEFDKIKTYVDEALPLLEKMNSEEGKTIAHRGMALYYLYKKDYVQAKKSAELSLKIAAAVNLKYHQQKAYEMLSNVAYAQHDMMLAEEYLRKGDIVGDSLLIEDIRKTAADLEKKYETEKKETQINQLNTERKVQELALRQKNTLNYILLGSVAAVLLLTLLAWRNYRQKQLLQRKRIDELETEKKLMATEAVLKGEEQERTRLAKDLHDGLGGMLSGIKHSFSTMKGNLIMTSENQQAFERSMDMLDSSIKELRRVAHNMMPEALLKFGLDTALRDFCADINKSGAIHVEYQSLGLETAKIDPTASITIYRIVQELLGNAMKHAAAKNAIVQVSKVDDQINITVEDDGKGFDPAILQQARGMGWSNIKSRVDFLKGKLDVQSQPGKGTSVYIELNT